MPLSFSAKEKMLAIVSHCVRVRSWLVVQPIPFFQLMFEFPAFPGVRWRSVLFLAGKGQVFFLPADECEENVGSRE